MGKVSVGLIGDGLPLTDGSSEQMGDVGLSLVYPLGCSHMDGTVSRRHTAIFKEAAVLSRGFPSF